MSYTHTHTHTHTHTLQVFVPVDKSLGEVWRVRVVSGANSSEEVFVQASCLEEFTAPVFSDSLSQIYHIKKTIGRYSVCITSVRRHGYYSSVRRHGYYSFRCSFL